MDRKQGVADRVKAMIEGSRWAGLAGKLATYGAVIAALSLIGSGRCAAWLTPPARLAVGIATAEAAPPPAPGASAAGPPIETLQAGAAGPHVEAPRDPPADAGATAETADAGASGVAPDGKVILNLATEQDLRRLPGVGATRARAILALRARMKKFTRVEDLLKVKGFGRRTIARLRPLVRVD